MFRARIETLEKRRMFCGGFFGSDGGLADTTEVPAIEAAGDVDIYRLTSGHAAQPKFDSYSAKVYDHPGEWVFRSTGQLDAQTVLKGFEVWVDDKDLFVALLGDFNGDGKDDLSSFTVDSRPEIAALIIESFSFGETNFIIDGVSNTAMLGNCEWKDIVLTGQLREDVVPSGITAILVGSTLDPRIQKGNTAEIGNVTVSDGSVQFLATNKFPASEQASSQAEAARNRIIIAILGDHSETATIVDDVADVPVSNNSSGGRASQVSHDAEFESWANGNNFDRGYLPPALVDALAQNILHEDNAFSFPRMSKGEVVGIDA